MVWFLLGGERLPSVLRGLGVAFWVTVLVAGTNLYLWTTAQDALASSFCRSNEYVTFSDGHAVGVFNSRIVCENHIEMELKSSKRRLPPTTPKLERT